MSDAVKLIRKAETFLLLSHASPDIDSIASASALAFALRDMGKRVLIGLDPDLGPQTTHFAKEMGVVIDSPDYKVDCIIVVDTNSPALFDFASVVASKAKKIIIDHHSAKDDVVEAFDAHILNERAVSASQIVYGLIQDLDVPISKRIALAVSAGIVTDSANFIAATPECFKILSDSLTSTKTSFQDVLRLINVPIDVSEKIARIKGAQRLEIERVGDFLIASTRVSSFEGSVARALLALGVDVAFVGAEKDGEVRISARARIDLVEKGLHLGRDILPAIAPLIQGDAGGHAAAAGANGVNSAALDNALAISVAKTKEFLQTL